MRTRFVGIACLCTLFLIGQSAQASLDVGFYRISNNSTSNIASQLQLTVYGYGESLPFSDFLTSDFPTLSASQALFVFENTVGTKSNVAEIYVDDRDVLSESDKAIFNTDDSDANNGLRGSNGLLLKGLTTFAFGSPKPPDLPGGDSLNPVFDADEVFSADTDPGNPNLGLNQASERVAILFSVNSYKGFSGLGAIEAALADGALRFGLHVRSIGTDGQSDGYLSVYDPGNGNEVVPEPASIAVWSLFAGSFGLAGVVRRRRKA